MGEFDTITEATLMRPCDCLERHAPRRVVLTGGPWSGHPHRVVADATEDFLSKASHVLKLLRDEVPECCRHHVQTFLWDGDTRARRLAARAGEQA